MLVFTRKAGEQVVIGDEVRLMVLEVRGSKVKLGFSGPVEVPIHRSEVLERGEDGALPSPSRNERGRTQTRLKGGSPPVTRLLQRSTASRAYLRSRR
jgi:carbon storage regulator